MLEDFLFALTNFRRNKIRTALSLLGIIIGVASVIVIMSMGSSSTKQVQNTFGSSGLDMVSISQGFFRRSRSAVTLNFDEDFRNELFDSVRNIKKIWYKNSVGATISYGETSASSQCSAVEYNYIESFGLNIEQGEGFNVSDDVFGIQKIILGSDIASTLFPNGDALGKSLMLVINNVRFYFDVAGVLKEQSSGMENSSNGCYIPRGFYTKQINPTSGASVVMVQAVSKEKTSELVEDIEKFCQEKSGTEGSVSVSSMQTMISQISNITKTMSVMLSAIAAISLLVGGIGIMNIMIVTVTERRQEIGIRKALGATPLLIQQQFLIESASITLLGGIIGIVLGILFSLGIEFVRSLSFVISWESCLISFFFSVVVGIFFGLSPAIRAAKLNPVEALNN